MANQTPASMGGLKPWEQRWQQQLAGKEAQGLLRRLKLPPVDASGIGLIDFTTNDYLGLRRLEAAMPQLAHGAGGSRLLGGNLAIHEEAEAFFETYFQADATLIFQSGYLANLGVISAIAQRGDTILYDKLCHASIKDALRLSHANYHSFKHNDLVDLERLLREKQGISQVFVITESVFSMDGDIAPLSDIASLCHSYEAALLVDEAHSTFLWGEKGAGLVQHLQLVDQVAFRIMTFGKGPGCHGAVVCCSQVAKDWFINTSRPFIYTTAPSPDSVMAMLLATQQRQSSDAPWQQLQHLIAYFQTKSQEAGIPILHPNSPTPIQMVVCQSPEQAKTITAQAQKAGLDIRPVLPPTVPAGHARIRLILHRYNSETEIDMLIQSLLPLAK